MVCSCNKEMHVLILEKYFTCNFLKGTIFKMYENKLVESKLYFYFGGFITLKLLIEIFQT